MAWDVANLDVPGVTAPRTTRRHAERAEGARLVRVRLQYPAQPARADARARPSPSPSLDLRSPGVAPIPLARGAAVFAVLRTAPGVIKVLLPPDAIRWRIALSASSITVACSAKAFETRGVAQRDSSSRAAATASTSRAGAADASKTRCQTRSSGASARARARAAAGRIEQVGAHGEVMVERHEHPAVGVVRPPRAELGRVARRETSTGARCGRQRKRARGRRCRAAAARRGRDRGCGGVGPPNTVSPRVGSRSTGAPRGRRRCVAARPPLSVGSSSFQPDGAQPRRTWRRRAQRRRHCECVCDRVEAGRSASTAAPGDVAATLICGTTQPSPPAKPPLRPPNHSSGARTPSKPSARAMADRRRRADTPEC